jgi:hypothetical protein
MYCMKRYFISLIIILTSMHGLLLGHGFGAQTLVRLANGYLQPISTLCSQSIEENIDVASFDVSCGTQPNRTVKEGGLRCAKDKFVAQSKERKINTLTKPEINNRLKGRYQQREDGKWYLRDGAEAILDNQEKKIEVLKWDNLHNELEAYTDKRCKRGTHTGALDPDTLKIYKAGDPDRSDRS